MNMSNRKRVEDYNDPESINGDFTGEVDSLKTTLGAGDRSLKLAALRSSIQAGTYHVSSADLADRLTRRMRQPR